MHDTLEAKAVLRRVAPHSLSAPLPPLLVR